MRAGRGCWCEIGDGYVLVGNIKLDFWEGSKGQGKIGALATIRQSRDRGNERENVIKRELKPDQTKAGQDRAGQAGARRGQGKPRQEGNAESQNGPDETTRPNHQGNQDQRRLEEGGERHGDEGREGE